MENVLQITLNPKPYNLALILPDRQLTDLFNHEQRTYQKCLSAFMLFELVVVGFLRLENGCFGWLQFEVLLQPTLPLDEAVNINAVWANLIVEECCRLGVTVCIPRTLN